MSPFTDYAPTVADETQDVARHSRLPLVPQRRSRKEKLRNRWASDEVDISRFYRFPKEVREKVRLRSRGSWPELGLQPRSSEVESEIRARTCGNSEMLSPCGEQVTNTSSFLRQKVRSCSSQIRYTQPNGLALKVGDELTAPIRTC